jgi:uncharacterized protein (UPF0332 family)
MSEIQDEAVRYWWGMAEESILAAQREFEAEAYTFAVNRIYYASFYAVSAVLLDRQLSFAKHSGVRAAFHQHIVKSGLLEMEWGKFYDRLFEDRQEGDYLTFISFDQDYVLALLARAEQFLKILKPLTRGLS